MQVNPAFLEEMKRGIETLPLETNAVTSVGARLGALDAPAFAALLKELARDNHAFRYDIHLVQLHLKLFLQTCYTRSLAQSSQWSQSFCSSLAIKRSG